MIPIENENRVAVRAANKKYLAMLVVGLVIVAVLLFAYYFSEKAETGGDNVVVVAVRGYLSVEQKDALTMQFNGYLPEDADENLTLQIFEFPNSNSPHAADGTVSQMLNQLTAEIQDGQADLLLVDQYVYGLLSNDVTLFEDLSVRYPNDPAVVDKIRYAIKDKPFVNASGLEGLPDCYLMLRSGESSIVNKNAQTLEKYVTQSALLDNIVHSTPPDDYATLTMEK